MRDASALITINVSYLGVRYGDSAVRFSLHFSNICQFMLDLHRLHC